MAAIHRRMAYAADAVQAPSIAIHGRRIRALSPCGRGGCTHQISASRSRRFSPTHAAKAKAKALALAL
ncbi:hypothetical protein, partial [Xanthomonas translucens]|uniref:hypothetical protein n=1 Tax=Xanthomonas campestris pv. translucens TaxID=343 RepID=UPI001C400536